MERHTFARSSRRLLGTAEAMLLDDSCSLWRLKQVPVVRARYCVRLNLLRAESRKVASWHDLTFDFILNFQVEPVC